MKFLFVLILPLLTIGCTPKTIIKTEIVEVKVPVSVPCKITPPKRPLMPVDALKKEDDLHTKVKVALAELEIREAYEKTLESSIKECQ